MPIRARVWCGAAMHRALVVLVLLAAPASASPRVTPARHAKAQNDAALRKALAKMGMKPIALAAMPAAPEEATDDGGYVATVIDGAPAFAVGANKDVYRVVRKIQVIRRVKARVCHAGPRKPIRVNRTRYAVPAGHTFKGDVEVSYGAVVVDEQNTCRSGS